MKRRNNVNSKKKCVDYKKRKLIGEKREKLMIINRKITLSLFCNPKQMKIRKFQKKSKLGLIWLQPNTNMAAKI